ncbi:glycosyltransferase family 2 protein [Paenibacillus koleovorans]|uniref:glycosyltransferase family 2 protein n=1 Tax=Paenibacillus koleovorans TaxID=121608 RepID=UPI000FDBBCC8|nr:glycosyltransferase [Paenibacillus koleovorans]
MGIQVSIIMPSYNRYPLNLLSLQVLERQDCGLSNFEVILIDDASTDGTPLLRGYRAPYTFRYMRNHIKLGCSVTRNIGLRVARGSILIFMDAEVLVKPDFIRQHVRWHHSATSWLVTSRYTHRLFSHLFGQYNTYQKSLLTAMLEERPSVQSKLLSALGVPDLSAELLPACLAKLKQPLLMLDRAQLDQEPELLQWSAPRQQDSAIVQAFHDRFRMPWLAATTMNHSIRRDVALSIGGFDESFVNPGLEDYEYGYRLNQRGVQFVFDPAIAVFHQEHPILKERRSGGTSNLILFQRKHAGLDVALMSLPRVQVYDFAYMDRVLAEKERLDKDGRGRFRRFWKAQLRMLKRIPILMHHNRPIKDLLSNCGYNEKGAAYLELLKWERDELERLGFVHSARLYDILTDL